MKSDREFCMRLEQVSNEQYQTWKDNLGRLSQYKQGYQEGYWFYFINGEKCDPGWFEDEDGHKYYFDSRSRMKTGYVREDRQKYFFNDGTYEEVPLGAYIPGI